MTQAGVQTRTSVHVTAKAYTYIANEISRIFYDVIQSAGLDPTAYANLQRTIEAGLRTWITMQKLEAAHLEIVEPGSQRVRSRVDLGLTYGGFNDDQYSTDMAKVRQALAGTVRMDGCEYRVVVTLGPNAPSVAGWGPTNLGSVDHLQRNDVGDVVNTPAGSVQMYRYI